MSATGANVPRILVVARPTIGRDLAARLGADRFEIHRSPDIESATQIIRRLRPNLVVALPDAPNLVIESMVDPIRAHIAGIPVIVLTRAGHACRDRGVIGLPPDADGDALRRAVMSLLNTAATNGLGEPA